MVITRHVFKKVFLAHNTFKNFDINDYNGDCVIVLELIYEDKHKIIYDNEIIGYKLLDSRKFLSKYKFSQENGYSSYNSENLLMDKDKVVKDYLDYQILVLTW